MAEITPQLYDEGEEDWELKLHVECGPVYLDGYKNIAPAGFHPYERPGLVEANKTDVKNYWARLPDDELHIKTMPDPDRTALDALSDMRRLPYGPADKILCLESLANLTVSDANTTLLAWWNVLKPGGILIVSVPDPTETRKLLDFWPGLNAYGLLHALYTEEKLRKMLAGYGFVDIQKLKNVHPYPGIVLKAKKADPFVPGRAYQKLPELQKGWNILDVGPGSFPLAAATHFLDKKRFPEVPEDAPMTIFDLNDNPRMPFHDDSFDFVYCSHVLEHLERPVAILEEIQRIGKRGYIEIPSVCKDFMFKHGQAHPKWACWGSEDVLIFIEKTKEQNRLFLDFERVFGGFFHSAVHGKHLTAVQRAIRFNFYENQHLLNISASWDVGAGTWDQKRLDFPVKAVEIRLAHG